MNEKIHKNAKVEKFTIMLELAVRLIVIDPFQLWLLIKEPPVVEILRHQYVWWPYLRF